MDGTDVLAEGLGRVTDHVRGLLDGLDTDQLAVQPASGANSIGWQLWHLTRGIDSQVTHLGDGAQVWVTDGFAQRLGFEPDPTDTGYGHSATEAASVRIDDAAVFLDYVDAVVERACARLDTIDDADLDVVIDEHWDPPVTEGVRWVSIIGDCLQHIGQAAYLKGMLADS